MIDNLISETDCLLEFRQVYKVYGSGQAAMIALKGVNMKIRSGEFVSVMGPSGSGKSTCMNILGCLDTPTRGDYLFSGVNVKNLTRKQQALLRRYYIGFVFQGFNLLNRTSALENVSLPLFYRGIPSRQRKKLAEKAMEIVGLNGWESHTPGELSGGQQQRVAIARALVSEPKVLFADEPTGNLDSERSKDVMELLTRLNTERHITIVMVTHENEMAEYAQRKIRFLDGVIDNDMHNGGRQ